MSGAQRQVRRLRSRGLNPRRGAGKGGDREFADYAHQTYVNRRSKTTTASTWRVMGNRSKGTADATA